MARRKANQETVPQYTSFPCYTDRRSDVKKVKKESSETETNSETK
jgi:hypothetical protein